MTRLASLAVVAVWIGMSAGGCASMSGQERHEKNVKVAESIEQHLLAVVADPFFPRVMDSQRGGFKQNFDRNWNEAGDPAARFVVFQARTTYAAAAIAEDRKGLRPRFMSYADPGFRELRDVLWDKELGGFYWGRRADGAPLEKYGEQKFAYGQAFAIYALAQYYATSKDPAALDLARKAFAWFEQHAHDPDHGGYFEVMRRDGSRITGSGYSTVGGWPLSLKTSNTEVHVLEAYTKLYEVDPRPEVRERLVELVQLFRDRIVLPDTGSLGETFQDDWSPASTKVSYGHDVEAAHLMLSAMKALGLEVDVKTAKLTRKLVDRALDKAFDWDHGGLFENSPEGKTGHHRPKVWWAQDEMLLALAVMHERYHADTDKYWAAFKLQWAAISGDFTDRVSVGRVKQISAERVFDYGKTDDWTEAYHDTRCLLATARVLRGMKFQD